MNRNRLTSELTADQLRQYNHLTSDHERRLFLDSLDIIDLTATPTPERAAQKHPLPYNFLPDVVNDASKPQQADRVGTMLTHMAEQQQQLTEQVRELGEQLLKPADVEGVIRQQVEASLQDVPQRLSEAVELFVKKAVPAAIRVENPSEGLLRLTCYLSIGLVAAGLGLGGLFFWGLALQTRLTERTPGYQKYRYLQQKAKAEADHELQSDLNAAERLINSPQHRP